MMSGAFWDGALIALIRFHSVDVLDAPFAPFRCSQRLAFELLCSLFTRLKTGAAC